MESTKNLESTVDFGGQSAWITTSPAPYQVMPPPTPEEYDQLKHSILMDGLQVPIIKDEQGQTIDGHTRAMICRDLGVEDYPIIVIPSGLTDAEKRTKARIVNMARRHLTRTQKKTLIRDQLIDTPHLSDRQIGKSLGVSNSTISIQRKKLEDEGVLCESHTSLGSDGRIRKRQITGKDLSAASTSNPPTCLQTRMAATKDPLAVMPSSDTSPIDLEAAVSSALPENLINQVFCGDAAEVLKNFPDNYVDMVITSPPYDNLREYGGDHFDLDMFKKISTQIVRILKTGGVFVLVVGDQTINGSESGTSMRMALHLKEDQKMLLHDTMIYEKNSSSFPASRRSKRYTQLFEYMFIFSKGKPPKTANLLLKKNKYSGQRCWGKNTDRQADGTLVEKKQILVPEYSPQGNIWKYNVGGGKVSHPDTKKAFKHPATFPLNLATDHIKTWTDEFDLVLDPMAGSGTSLVAAKQLGRSYIGVDINPEYVALAQERIFAADDPRLEGKHVPES